jgi:putative glutamine amidotransferase
MTTTGTTRPRIGVSPNRRPGDYLESVTLAGGDPVLLDAVRDRAADVLAGVAGVLLTGGGDIDPSLYGEAADPTFSPAEPGRDAFEIELAVRAIEYDVPVLAICRGIQVLNVALGGTLVQDIPTAIPQAVTHSVPHPTSRVAHEVALAPGSRLAALLCPGEPRRPTCAVNSRHHQSVKRPGAGLRVTATAPDGVVEAVEREASRFCVGVQWHPENFCRTGEFRALFDDFIASCAALTGRKDAAGSAPAAQMR